MIKLDKNPKVSVILTSYNHEKYISAAIESVLNQTFTDFELLIIDDGSTDKSREIIKKFTDSRIKTYLYAENRGPVLAIRDAVNSARGKYIAVHHSDDLWTPNKLEKQVKFLETNEKYAACFTWVDFIDEKGDICELEAGDFYKNVFDQPNRSRAEWLNYFFYKANCLCHPSAMVKREAYEKYHLLELNGFWQLPDLLMWIRLCFNAEIFILPERLTQFRLRRTRQENTSATSFDRLVRADLEFYFIAQEFVYNFTSDKFFLEVFPSASKFLIGERINRRFAFAKICLEKKSAAFQLAGLELLKNLLGNPVDAAEIKTLYDYDEKIFLRDGGNYDIFNISQKLNMLHAEIFVSNGEEFSLVAEKVISVDATKKFYLRIDFDLAEPVKYLRFDPDMNFISLKITRALINGELCNDFSSNAGEIADDFHRFLTNDPQIIFDVKNLSGRVILEVFGELEANYPEIIEQTMVQNKNLQAEIQRLNQVNNSLLNSKSWKITAPLRDFNKWIHYNNKDKILSLARLFYRSIPFSDEKKLAIKDKFYSCLEPLIKDTATYKNWQKSKEFLHRPPIQAQNIFEGEFLDQPGKIAIQIHIFYLDLLSEMVSTCKIMPYKFDALISIVDESAAAEVQAAFEKIPTVEKVIVRVVPNRGRDVAPFLAGFGDILPDYDFIAHIHTKKSLYSGSEQFTWRKYLFNSLFSNKNHIRKIFKAFIDDKNVGVIYPRPAPNVPYAAFNWLSNKKVGEKLLNQAKIAPNKTDYFDFPAGTMFWARTRALRKIFDLNLTFEDFPPEKSQNDGTLAHAFERSILLATRSENMNYYEFDPADARYSINVGDKNLWQYFKRKDSDVRNGILNQAEIVSFAVFDTLLMRCVAKPYHVKEIIQLKIPDLLDDNFDFITFRNQAELQARQIKGNDPTLDEIYKSFSELTGLDAEICKKIRELEVSTELTLIFPRERIINWFKIALERGKKMWIISDTCLQTPDIERFLKKCGVEGYEKLLISCETGMRKDTAEIWEYLKQENLNSPYKFTHLGANEMADIQLPGDLDFGQYHLMSAINLLSQVPFGRFLLENLDYKMSLYAGIMLGVILAKKFHDPFKICAEFTEESGQIILENPHEVGYWLYGVPLLTSKLRQEKSFAINDEELRAGAEDFCRDVLEIFGDIIQRVPIDENFVDIWAHAFDYDKKILSRWR